MRAASGPPPLPQGPEPPGAGLLSAPVLDQDGPLELRLFPPFRARLRLNASSADALEALPGLGPKAAEHIVEFRAEHGPLTELSELEEVPGLRKNAQEAMQPFVTLDGLMSVGRP